MVGEQRSRPVHDSNQAAAMTGDTPMKLGKNLCPHCGTELDVGFGLAGGGYGAYIYCPAEACGKYFDKTQEQREDDA